MTKVSFPTKLSSQMYRKAKLAFPNEEYAILLGRKIGNDYKIEQLYFPIERLNTQNPDFVAVKTQWFENAQEIARGLGFEVLGDIHSHCYEESEGAPGTDPSEADWEYAEWMLTISGGKYRLLGIVRVLKKRNKMSCRSRFWPAVSLPVKTT